MMASATVSSTATMPPKTVVTTRYARVPVTKLRSESVIHGRSRAISDSRRPAHADSVPRNSSSASRNTRFVTSPPTPASKDPASRTSFPVSTEDASQRSWGSPTPNRPSVPAPERVSSSMRAA